MSAGAVGQLVALLTGGAVLSFLISLATVRASRRKILAEAGATDADAAEKIKKSALDLVGEMEADAKEARVEVRTLRAELRQMESQLSKAVAEGTAAVDELRRIRLAILDPAATIGALRAMVGDRYPTPGRYPT